MENLGASLGWGLVVGASLVVGAVAAAFLRLPSRFAAALTAFGGGVLFAAIALELVPEADRQAGVPLTALGLLAGTLVYVAADAWLSRDPSMDRMRRSGHAAAAGQPMMMHSSEAARGESIAAGLFVDGVPESIALGLTVAEGEIGVALLAGVLVGNVVEAYGAAQPIVAGGTRAASRSRCSQRSGRHWHSRRCSAAPHSPTRAVRSSARRKRSLQARCLR